ncbi:hypothetical protein WN944_029581 [Citrus x changshan-huyou]|uniref:Uncharacterized protein n=1 Tax=Citrus x changshan-huyou TaxID=2935761 RepID=A0AAP0QB88_9ROSI
MQPFLLHTGGNDFEDRKWHNIAGLALLFRQLSCLTYDLPFNDTLDWKKFSMIIREDDVHRLNLILKGIITKGKFINSHKNTFKAQKHFEWNTPPM